MIIEIFRIGKHKDSAGIEREYSEADLDKMASAYNPANHEAPVVLGHPADNAPAYGWVKSLWRKGERLYAELGDLAPEFVDWVKRKLYKKRSISLYADGTLRHIGFLGAVPPAVKGLADVQFAQGDSAVIEFMDSDDAMFFRSIGRMFASMRDFFIEKFGQETADKTLSTWEIDMLKQAEAATIAANSFTNHKSPSQEESVELTEALAKIAGQEQEIATLKTQNTAFSETITAKDTEIAALNGRIAAGEKERRDAEHASFCEQLIAEGRLAPKMKSATMSCLESAFRDSATQQFSEGQKSPYQDLRDALKESPVVVEFKELATKTNATSAASSDEDPASIAVKARQYQDTEGKNGHVISISEAVAHVTGK